MSDLFVKLPDGVEDLWVKLPDGVEDFWVKLPTTEIDPQKVIVLVNSDVALSDTIADYYITKRGLNASHKITKSLGTHDTTVAGTDGATPATFYNNVVKPIADYIDANDIEAVIGSARVPHLVNCDPQPTTLLIATMSVLGSSRYVRDELGAMVKATSAQTTTPRDETLLNSWFHSPYLFNYSGDQTVIAELLRLDFREKDDHIPYGRIGLPKFEAAVSAETEAESKRMIDDAYDMDGQGFTAGEIHFGMHDRTSGVILSRLTAHQSELARLFAIDKSITTKHYIRSFSANWPDQAPAESYSYADCVAGNLNETAFGMLGTAISNEAVGANYVNSYTWPKGSWGFECTSFGHYLMANMLMNGACAAIGSVREPYSNYVNGVDAFFRALVSGRAICDAMLLGRITTPWMTDCWGDPLYAPYKVS